MIYINKESTPPSVLEENAEKWTEELMKNIDEYGGYEKVPQEVKNSMWVHYRDKDIKKVLFASSNEKCVFCEAKPAESGNIEVEHFMPKSLYPSKAFEWDNLLPVCRKCNDSKSNHDTGKEAIVNPSKEDPEKIFTYNFLNIEPLDEKDIVAERTIEICDLNSERLYDARARLLHSLCSYEKVVRAWLSEIDIERKRIGRINKLRDSVEILEKLTGAEQTYAGFCRFFLRKSVVYNQAKRMLKEMENVCANNH